MPAAVAAIAAVAAAVGSAIASVASAIASVIGAVAGAVASAVGSIIGPITTAIGTVITRVGGVVGTVADALAGVIEGGLSGFVDLVGGAVSHITSGLKAGIEAINETIIKPVAHAGESAWETMRHQMDRIRRTAEPILAPIRDGMQLVHDKLAAIDAWVRTTLKPIDDVINLVDQVSQLKILFDLVKGQADISDVLAKVAAGETDSTAAAIARLYLSITEMGVNLIDYTEKKFTVLDEKVRHFDETFKASLDQLQRAVEDKMAIRFDNIDKVLFGQADSLAMKVAAVTRRTEDLPWFAYMLLQVLK